MSSKVAVVTGASSGIGKAIAEELASHGFQVVGLARRFQQQPNGVLSAGDITAWHCDVGMGEDVARVFSQLKRVDVVVNSAGLGYFSPVVETTQSHMEEMLRGHILGTFLCCQSALPLMMPKKSGHIINVGSVAVKETFTSCGGYTAAKAGQMALSRVLREEMREHNIRVTDVLPGASDTPIWDSRPEFDRTKMVQPRHIASMVWQVLAHPDLSVDEIVVTPPCGTL